MRRVRAIDCIDLATPSQKIDKLLNFGPGHSGVAVWEDDCRAVG
jgi:hypothetical protein